MSQPDPSKVRPSSLLLKPSPGLEASMWAPSPCTTASTAQSSPDEDLDTDCRRSRAENELMKSRWAPAAMDSICQPQIMSSQTLPPSPFPEIECNANVDQESASSPMVPTECYGWLNVPPEAFVLPQEVLQKQDRAVSTLTNVIDPIWQQCNFRSTDYSSDFNSSLETFNDPANTISDLVYERILPALQACTILFHQTEDFHMKLWSAERIYGEDSSTSWLDPNYTIKDYDRQGYRGHVRDIVSKRLRIFMGRCQDFEENHDSYAYTNIEFVAKRHPFMYIQLSHNYLNFFRDPHYSRFDPERKQRVLFMLTTTLMHEMAHLTWKMRHIGEIMDGNGGNPEVLYEPESPKIELGHAWENSTFAVIPEFKSRGRAGRCQTYEHTTSIQCWTWHEIAREHIPAVSKGLKPSLEAEEVAVFFDRQAWEIAIECLETNSKTHCVLDAMMFAQERLQHESQNGDYRKATFACGPSPPPSAPVLANGHIEKLLRERSPHLGATFLLNLDGIKPEETRPEAWTG